MEEGSEKEADKEAKSEEEVSEESTRTRKRGRERKGPRKVDKEKRKEFCPARPSKLVSITTEQAQSNPTAKEQANFKVSQNVSQARNQM